MSLVFNKITKAILMANDIKNINDISQGGKKPIKGINAIVKKACDMLEAMPNSEFHYSEIFDSPGRNEIIFREVADDIEISEAAIKQALLDAAPHIKDSRQLPHMAQITGAAPEAFAKSILQNATFANKDTLIPEISKRIKASAQMAAFEVKATLAIIEETRANSGQVINPEASGLSENTRVAELIDSVPNDSTKSVKGFRWYQQKELEFRGPELFGTKISRIYNDGVGKIVEDIQAGRQIEVKLHGLPDELGAVNSEEQMIKNIKAAYGDELLKAAGVDFEALKAAGAKTLSDAAAQAKLGEQKKLENKSAEPKEAPKAADSAAEKPKADTTSAQNNEVSKATESAANDTKSATQDKSVKGNSADKNPKDGKSGNGDTAKEAKPTTKVTEAESKGTKFLGMLKKEGGLTKGGKWAAAATVVGAASAAYLATRDKPENDSSHTR